MVLTEDKKLKEMREVAEREIIVAELEKLKNGEGADKKYVLIIADEGETCLLSYNIDYFEEIVWALNIAQSLAMVKIQEGQMNAKES